MFKSKNQDHETPFESHYITIRGNRIHYFDEGEGSVIVLLPSSPYWSYCYRKVIPELAKNHRVIVPDYMGMGLSDKPQLYQYNLENHIDNLERLIFELDLEEVSLVMHGWGAPIGMGFAQRHPHRIAGIIFLNSAAFAIDYLPLRVSFFRIPKFGSYLIRKFNLYQRCCLNFTGHKKLSKEIRKHYMAPYNTVENRIGIDAFVKDVPMDITHYSYEIMLEIEHGLWMFKEHPVLIIWSVLDWRFPLSTLKRWKQFYPQAKVKLLKESASLPMEDSPIEMSNYIKYFCKTNNL